jgi:hypothetical protein
MTGYIIEIQEDDSGELFIELPDELIDELLARRRYFELGFKG